MGPILVWIFHISFSTLIGGYFLWSASSIYDEWMSGGKRRRKRVDVEPPRELKTTDAGPYTAPGVPTEPDFEDPTPLHDRDAEEPLSVLAACGINFVVYWTSFAACIALGFWLYDVSARSNQDHLTVWFPWLAPLLCFSIGWFFHSIFLLNPLRAFVITCLLIVPWLAAGAALWGVCNMD